MPIIGLQSSKAKNRIDIIDAIRGFAILAMVVYHALYDINDIFGFHIALFDMLTVLEPPFAGAFILLSGVSSRFSHSNTVRGVRVLVFGLLLTAVTVLLMPDQAIYFGILHFLGCAILLFALFRPALDKIPRQAALVLYLLLFAVTFRMPYAGAVGFPGWQAVLPSAWYLPYARIFGGVEGTLSAVGLRGSFLNGTAAFFANLFQTFLAALGVPGQDFFSADYFSLVPWLFLFLAGTVIGVPIKKGKFPQWFYDFKVPFFAQAGRYTLAIYIIHQPVIYGILYVIFKFVR